VRPVPGLDSPSQAKACGYSVGAIKKFIFRLLRLSAIRPAERRFAFKEGAMMARFSLSTIAVLILVSGASAQTEPWKFHWRVGQTLNYGVEHVTAIEEIAESQTTNTRSKLQNTKHWQVLEVDQAGIATLQLTLTSIRMEMTTPSGEVMTFDSASPEKSTPALKAQMEKYVGQPLAVIRVDPRGQVVAVKECKFGSASRFESEPPFAIVLPEAAATGANWERTYKLTLEPPQGTGEKFDAVQSYASRSGEGGTATIALTTALKSQPEAVAEQTALFQSLPEGEIIFDPQNGIMQSAKLQIDKQAKGQQGEGSSYRFQSIYRERYLGAN
jgi:hypothetical protein